MVLASFGKETFYVDSTKGIYTPSDLSVEYGKTIETQSTAGKKPVSYIGDINLVKSGFKLHLDNRFVDVLDKIYTWQNMAQGNELYVFAVGGYFVSTNKFAVTSVKVSNVRVNGRGEMISADLDISIEEYAGKSSKLKTKPLSPFE